MNVRRMDGLNALIRGYNDNMREYQQNISDMIYVIRRIDAEPQLPDVSSNDMYEPDSTPILETPILETPLRNTIYTALYNYLSPNLSQAQIAAATREFIATEEHVGETCPIGLDHFCEGDELCQIIHCEHTFRTANIRRWFERHTQCPVCRHDILNLNTPVPPLSQIFRQFADESNPVYTFDFTYR